MTQYTARSASDNTDDWPFWMVWDGQINVTLKALCSYNGVTAGSIVGMPFVSRKLAETLADHMNKD